MKVAFFTHPFAPIVGGIETSVATFAEDLRALGHEVLIGTSTPDASAGPDSGLLRIAPLPERDRLFSALDTFGPDVIQVHQPFLLGKWAQEYARDRCLPLVHTHHTLYDRAEDRGHLGGLAALESAARELAIAFSAGCDAVVAPTASIAAMLRDQGLVGPIAEVPTGIDTRRFASGDGTGFRQRHGIPENIFVVGHLGRLVPAKRIGFLTDAITAFLSATPGAVALICGEGEMAAPLAAAFYEAGLSDRLHLLGRLDEREIADAYAAMDVFTFASLTDTQGLVLLEAMAAGTPVLALRATGPRDVVRDEVTGRLLDPAVTPADFARALADFHASFERPRFADAARRHAYAYDRRSCAAALLEVYRQAIARPRERPPAPDSDPERERLDALQDRVISEWLRLADAPPSLHALLPTRGFPGYDRSA